MDLLVSSLPHSGVTCFCLSVCEHIYNRAHLWYLWYALACVLIEFELLCVCVGVCVCVPFDLCGRWKGETAEMHSCTDYRRRKNPVHWGAKGIKPNLAIAIKRTHRYKDVDMEGLSCLVASELIVCLPPFQIFEDILCACVDKGDKYAPFMIQRRSAVSGPQLKIKTTHF